jgi:hypothetical protein
MDDLDKDLERIEDSSKVYADAVDKATKQNERDIQLRKQVYEQSLKQFKMYETQMARQTTALERIAKALEKRK